MEGAAGQWGLSRGMYGPLGTQVYNPLNFTNLATAQSLQRSKEVGLRKVVGAQKWQLITQYLGEAVFYAFLALVLAIGLLGNFSLTQNIFATGAILSLSNWKVISVLCLLGLLIGITAGLYPAFVISSSSFRLGFCRGETARSQKA